MGNLIEIEGVDVAYAGQALVLRDATASFDAGLTHAVTGPSGCGKSTLLYVTGLMLRPSTGKVAIDGIDYARSSDRIRASAERARSIRIPSAMLFFASTTASFSPRRSS